MLYLSSCFKVIYITLDFNTNLSYLVLQDPCLKKVCQFYSRCVKAADNSVSCVCPSACTKDYQPVCGTDNFTYTNNCTRIVAACTTKKDIGILKNMACEGKLY